MMNPGTYVLYAGEITTALTGEEATAIVDLEGMLAASIVAKLAYVSGGTTVIAKIQTSLDGGTTYLDVARFDFSTASSTRAASRACLATFRVRSTP